MRAEQKRNEELRWGLSVWNGVRINPIFKGKELEQVRRECGPEIAEMVRRVLEERQARVPPDDRGDVGSCGDRRNLEGEREGHPVA
jgi:hypothetical protein